MSQYSQVRGTGCDEYDGPLPSPTFCESSVSVKEKPDRKKFRCSYGKKVAPFLVDLRVAVSFSKRKHIAGKKKKK